MAEDVWRAFVEIMGLGLILMAAVGLVWWILWLFSSLGSLRVKKVGRQ